MFKLGYLLKAMYFIKAIAYGGLVSFLFIEWRFHDYEFVIDIIDERVLITSISIAVIEVFVGLMEFVIYDPEK